MLATYRSNSRETTETDEKRKPGASDQSERPTIEPFANSQPKMPPPPKHFRNNLSGKNESACSNDNVTKNAKRTSGARQRRSKASKR
jgi:hypothetical protein